MTEYDGVERSTATETFRAMLDERGVEWGDDGYPTTCTVWVSDGVTWHGLWRDDCIELIAHLTPEQAIAATLGTGTCHEVMINRHWRGCSECGYVWENMYSAGFQIGPNYCPMCGAKVVD